MNFDNPIYGSEGEMMSKGNSTIEEQPNGQVEQKDEPKNVFEDFGQSLAKIWPLNALKTINSLLLLLLGIITCSGNKYEFSIGWSRFGEAIPHIYINNNGIWTRTMDLNSCFLVMFFISIISLILFFVLRKNAKENGKFLFGISIADFIVALISIPICINAFAIYGLMAAAEWKYFYPKLTNSSMTLVELTGWSVQHGRWVDYIPPYYGSPSVTWSTLTNHPYQYQSRIGSTQRPWTGQTMPSTTPTPPPTTTMPIPTEWQFRSMAGRKRAILARIGIDSSATVISVILFIISICSKILLALLILLNLILVFRFKKLMKSTNLCPNDCRNVFFNDYKYDEEKNAKYLNTGLVGFFKFAHWFIPILVILLFPFYIYTLCIFQWICISFISFFFFVKWFKFRNNSLKFPQKIALIDFVISFLAIVFYIIFISSIRYGHGPLIMNFCQFSIFLHILHIIFILILYFKKEGDNSVLDLKLPLISINLAINVIHQNNKSDGNGNEEKKMEEGKPKEENINNGKEIGTVTANMMMTV